MTDHDLRAPNCPNMNAARGVLFWHVLKFTSYVWGKAGQMAGLMATLSNNNAARGVVSSGENRHGGPLWATGYTMYWMPNATRGALHGHVRRCTRCRRLLQMHNAARGVMHSDTTPRARGVVYSEQRRAHRS